MDDLERIAGSLAIVFGYIQLLQRRMKRGQAIDDVELFRVLGIIEVASRSMMAEITAVRADRRKDGKGSYRG